jgi:hypothetical protein
MFLAEETNSKGGGRSPLSTLMASDISSHEVKRKLKVKISGVRQTLCVIFPKYTSELIIHTILVSV